MSILMGVDVMPNAKWLHHVLLTTLESVWKEHMTTFHKRLFVYDPSLGPKFFQQVHVHNNMNPDLEIMMEKLQLLVSSWVMRRRFCGSNSGINSRKRLRSSQKLIYWMLFLQNGMISHNGTIVGLCIMIC
jgi:hypothetical protein